MEMYEPTFSEQAVIHPEPHPGGFPISRLSDFDRLRTIAMVLRRAHECVGPGGGPDLISRLDFILSRARQGNLPASIYENIWRLRGIFAEHVIISQVPTANIAGTTA